MKSNLIQAAILSTLFASPFCALAIEIVNSQPGPYSTNVDGLVEIKPSGQIAPVGADDAIIVNNTNPALAGGTGGIVIIDPANIHPTAPIFGSEAILITGTGNGINVVNTGLPNATIDIGAASGITLDSPGNAIKLNAAISVNNADTIITNAGTLQNVGNITATSGVILLNNAAKNTIINNHLNATIQNLATGTGGAGAPILDDGIGGTIINNSGNIISNTATINPTNAITINAGGSFNSINNHAGGLISQQAINGSAIFIANNGGGGDINNDAGGVINVTDANSFNSAIFIFVRMQDINNAGVILATKGSAIFINGNMTGGIVNTGTIESMMLAGSNNATIFNEDSPLPDGLTNTGAILATSGGSRNAINFSSGKVDIFQQDGVIGGNVFLASKNNNGAEVLNMTGGVITGNVITSPFTTSTLNLSGGAIDSAVNLQSADIVNLSGTAFVNRINGNSKNEIYNVSGGFFDLINASGVGSLLNVSASNTFGTPPTPTMFATQGVVNNIGIMHLQNPGTVLTANSQITHINTQLLLDEGTTLFANNLISFINGSGILNHGTIIAGPSTIGQPVFDLSLGGNPVWINNAGVVELASTAVITVMGNNTPDVVQFAPGSELITHLYGQLGGPPLGGQIVVNSLFAGEVVLLSPGSLLIPKFSGFMPDGQPIDIITVNDGANVGNLINDQSTLIQPPSATVSFTKQLTLIISPNNIVQGEILQLVPHRTPFVTFADFPAINVAQALDVLAQGSGPRNIDLFNLLSQLDQLTTGAEIDAALESLLPPLNYGLIEGSHIGMDSVFEGVTDRVWEIAWRHGVGRAKRPLTSKRVGLQRVPDIKSGTNAGDLYHNPAGIWLRPIGAYIDQGERDDIPGYKAKAWGGALGADLGLTPCSTVGLAVSYTHVNIDDKADAPKDGEIKSWMVTAYGSFDMAYGFFLDAMIAGANNDYRTNRVIAVNNLITGSQAEFDGKQWGVQGDLGMAIANWDMFFAPFVRLKYVEVDMDSYSESGAGGISLTVNPHHAHEFLGGIGIRVADDYSWQHVEWVPELMVMFAYDFENNGENSIANFIGGGPAFETDGVRSGRAIFDAGIALNAIVSNCSVFTVKYNLELREDFVGNSGYVQYFYYWG